MSDVRPVTLQVSCRNLRHKLMYIDERQQTLGTVDDSSDTRVFWCVKTQEALGPDADPVSPEDCRPDRGCYCGS